MAELHPEAADGVNRSDWAEMVKVLGAGRYTPEEVAGLFYPQRGGQGLERRSRRKDFLSGLEDRQYEETYQRLRQGERLRFPDVDKLLGTKKDEGQIMRQVMMHVVRWVNPTPDKATNIRASNKPLHRKSLVPALRSIYDMRVDLDERLKDAQAEADAIKVERMILDSVWGNISFFKSPASLARLERFPEAEDETGYAERFAEEPWEEILSLVKVSFGAQFKPPWREGGSSRPKACNLARSIVALMRSIPEVDGNADLSSYEALQELCEAIDGPVRQWESRRRGGTQQDNATDGARKGPVGLRQRIEEEQNDNQGNAIDESDTATNGDGDGNNNSEMPSPRSRVLLTPSPAKGQDARGTSAVNNAAGREAQAAGPGPTQQTPRNGSASRQREDSGVPSSGGGRERVNPSVRETVPVLPTRKHPVQVNDHSHAERQGSPIQSALSGVSQKARQLKKPREELPSIADILAGFHANNAYGKPPQSKRQRGSGTVAR